MIEDHEDEADQHEAMSPALCAMIGDATRHGKICKNDRASENNEIRHLPAQQRNNDQMISESSNSLISKTIQ
jgi:hypothetical protein